MAVATAGALRTANADPRLPGLTDLHWMAGALWSAGNFQYTRFYESMQIVDVLFTHSSQNVLGTTQRPVRNALFDPRKHRKCGFRPMKPSVLAVLPSIRYGHVRSRMDRIVGIMRFRLCTAPGECASGPLKVSKMRFRTPETIGFDARTAVLRGPYALADKGNRWNGAVPVPQDHQGMHFLTPESIGFRATGATGTRGDTGESLERCGFRVIGTMKMPF